MSRWRVKSAPSIGRRLARKTGVLRVAGRMRVAGLVLAAGVSLLAGCAGSRAYHQGTDLIASGRVEEGLAHLDEAARLEPRNVQYLIAARTQRTQAVNNMLAAAEVARREGRLTDEEVAYKRVQELDPANVMARQGLEALTMERRHRQILASAEAELAKGASADLDGVSEKVRQVLAENPHQPAALNLKARLEQTRAAHQQTPAAELASAYRKPITLEFHEAPLKSVFDAVSKVSGINFFFDKDLRPDLKATVLAKNVSIADAVRLVLVTNQLEQKVLSPNSVLIYPNTPQKLKDYQTLTVRTFYLANADVKAISNTFKTILKAQDLVTDERLGLIILRDTPEVIRLAERLVALQDVSDPEVMLDVQVLEIKRDRLLDLGVAWPDQATLAPLTASGQTLTLDQLLHFSRKNTQASINNATLTARHTDDDADILANPRIRVRNKDTARILIGDRVPVITTTSTSTGFVSDSVTYVDVGLKLEAEPNIYLDQDVAIKMHLEVSNLVKEVTSKSGTLAYQIGTRTADTVLRLKDGETQVLAGLIDDEDRVSATRVPGLGSLPVLSRLFGSRQDDHTRGEIVLSITPHIIRSIRRPDLVDAEFESGTQSAIGARALTFSTVEPDEKGDDKPADNSNTPVQGSSADAPGTAGAGGAVVGPGAVSGSSEGAPGAPSAGGSGVASAPPAGAPAAASVAPGSPSGSAPAASPPVAEVESKAAAVESKAAVLPPSGMSSPSRSSGFPPPVLAWQLPAKVKVGEQFTAVLSISSNSPLRGLPLLLSFDPQSLQVVSMSEGNFLRQGAAATDFSHRVDPIQGRVFIAAVRQNTTGHDVGATGTGSLVSVTFKAVRANEAAKVQVLSISPEPSPAAPIKVPLMGATRIVP